MPKIAIITLRIVTFAMIFLIITLDSVFADSPLVINEIFPDPKGKDKGNEWVELYNDSEKNIDLLGWKLNNGGKKDVTIKNPLMIGAGSYLVLEKENLKLALKNTDGQLQLIDTNGNLIDKIDYGKAEEGKSFSKIFFSTAASAAEKSKWSWSDPTKNQENDIFYILEGEIISGPSAKSDVENEPAAKGDLTDNEQQASRSESISIRIIEKSTSKTIALKLPDNQNLLLLATLLRPKTIAQFLVDKNGIIQDFKIRNPGEFPGTKTQNQESWIKYYLIILIGLCVIPLQLRKN